MASTKSKIESILFISNHPLTVKKLADLAKAETSAVQKALDELIVEYNQPEKGISIQKIDDKVQMVSSPDNTVAVKQFIKEETTGELTRAALETLTIIAYRGPVTRGDLEQIRGVNCAIILRNLLIRGLVESAQDKKKMATTYNITFDFLKFLGINQQSELPDFKNLSSDESIEKIIAQQTNS